MGNGNKKGAVVKISSDSIYLDSIATILIIADSQFEAKISGYCIELTKGTHTDSDALISSVEFDNKHQIELKMLGWFNERLVSEKHPHVLMNAYGMRYYPFVSSVIKGNITLHREQIELVLLDLPDAYRLIWNQAKLLDVGSCEATVKHAFTEERSTYVFRWIDCSAETQSIDMNVAVRFGGKSLLRTVNFPFIYWFLSLFIISIASMSGNTNVLLASVGGAWVFMLRQWNASNPPQENTLLTHAYLVLGLFIPIWALTWHEIGLWALGWAPLLIGFIRLMNISTRTFRTEGVLPKIVAEYWLKSVIDK